VEIIKPPWKLKGDGYIILYKFNNKFLEDNRAIPPFLKDKKVKGYGAVILVDYKESNVGPYEELLFIPGKFKHNSKKLATISRIYVSTKESVINGIENWAIPKELADFEIKEKDKYDIINISKDDQKIASFKFKPGFLPLPINTKIMPFPLVQKRGGKYYYTNFSGKGVGKISIIEEYNINGKFFPEITQVIPTVVIKVEGFEISFSEAEVKDE